MAWKQVGSVSFIDISGYVDRMEAYLWDTGFQGQANINLFYKTNSFGSKQTVVSGGLKIGSRYRLRSGSYTTPAVTWNGSATTISGSVPNVVFYDPLVILEEESDSPPTTPSSISASGTFQTGQQVTVSWGASTDADGDAITYYFDVSRNGGAFETYGHNMSGRSINYPIPSGTTSLQFRVRALANGALSGYRTSPTYTVTTNTPPTTPGAFTSPVAGTVLKGGETYTVRWGASTDADGDAITYTVQAQYWNESSQKWLGTYVTEGKASTSADYEIEIQSHKPPKIRFVVWARDNKGSLSSGRYSGEYTISYNAEPTLTLTTTNNRTLYENDIFTLDGSVTDTDVNNVVSVKYQINSGTVYPITSQISQGSAIPFSKSLTFKQNRLYDGGDAISDILSEGVSYTIKVWGEDDQGGKSAEQTRTFYVVPNRPVSLTLEPFTSRTDLVDTDTITLNGSITDPDGNNVTVEYKVNNSSFVKVYEGKDSPFSINITIDKFTSGDNTITVKATDSYGMVTTKTLTVTKQGNAYPLLESVTRYKLTPPNGTASGVVLWIQREVGDLEVSAEISMTMNGEQENFQPMTKASTAYVTDGIEEDEFTFQADGTKDNIVLKLITKRTSPTSNKAVTLISGVFS